MEEACLNCKRLNRKCNYVLPQCGSCARYKEPNCSYGGTFQNHSSTSRSDRRRRKYHTSYIDSLEDKASRLESFIRKFTEDDPILKPVFLKKLDGLEKRCSNAKNEEDFDLELLAKETSNLKLQPDLYEEQLDEDSHMFIDPFISELQESILNSGNLIVISETSNPVSLTKAHLFIQDINYQKSMVESFKTHFAIHSPALIEIVNDLESLNYNEISSLSLKLLFDVIIGLGNLYSSHQDKNSLQLYFISSARDSLMNIISKSKVDINLIISIYLLSCYELMQNHLSQSYLFISMACSLTQHIGLHISDDKKKFAPKQSPFNLAVLWSICLQDRLVTSLLKVPCVIHFKRIISPFYHVTTSNKSCYHLNELLFSYLTRLWYIFDRFSDQILTIKFDVGDSTNRLKLLNMGLKTLQELNDTLPMQLSESNNNNNFFNLVFKFNYKFSILKLNQIYINVEQSTNSLIVKKSIVRSTIDCCEILSHLNKDTFIEMLPFYSVNFIHLLGVNVLNILSLNLNDEARLKFKDYLDLIKSLLTKTSKFYKSSNDLLNNLIKLSIKLHISTNSKGTNEIETEKNDTKSIELQQKEFTQQFHIPDQPIGFNISHFNPDFHMFDLNIDSFKELDEFFNDWDNEFLTNKPQDKQEIIEPQEQEEGFIPVAVAFAEGSGFT